MDATVLFIFADVVNALKAAGYIDASNQFVHAQFDSLKADLAFASTVESILKAHGVSVPAKVDQIITIIPALAGLFA